MVELKYPYFLHSNAPNPHVDINTFVDTVLRVVYENIELQSTLKTRSRRSVIFSSFNPDICCALNLKQPNFAVFYACHCGYDAGTDVDIPSASTTTTDDTPVPHRRWHGRPESIQDATRFAKNSNLFGILCEAKPLVSF